MRTFYLNVLLSQVALSTELKSMMFRGMPVAGFLPSSSFNSPSAVCKIDKSLHTDPLNSCLTRLFLGGVWVKMYGYCWVFDPKIQGWCV